MQLVDLVTAVKDIRIHSRRYHIDDHGEYGELIFFVEDLPEWETVLHNHFGKPVKCPEEPVTESLMSLTAPFGELFDHQTLYLKENSHRLMLAMIWPWKDLSHATLKLIFRRKK
jgi:hypothetical protein